jgi:hypothetical protein
MMLVFWYIDRQSAVLGAALVGILLVIPAGATAIAGTAITAQRTQPASWARWTAMGMIVGGACAAVVTVMEPILCSMSLLYVGLGVFAFLNARLCHREAYALSPSPPGGDVRRWISEANERRLTEADEVCPDPVPSSGSPDPTTQPVTSGVPPALAADMVALSPEAPEAPSEPESPDSPY